MLARILEVEEIDDGRVVVSCEVIMDGAVIAASTMIGVIAEGLQSRGLSLSPRRD